MPFVPRSQIEQQQANAAPPPMPVVENYATPRVPVLSDNSNNTEEQISELNELLVHVLDEISSLKNAIYDNTRREDKTQVKKKHKKTERVKADDSESDTSEEDTNTIKKKTETTTRRGGIDFSGCF